MRALEMPGSSSFGRAGREDALSEGAGVELAGLPGGTTHPLKVYLTRKPVFLADFASASKVKVHSFWRLAEDS